MVCTLGRGEMAAMVRLLRNGNHPEVTAAEARHEKLAAQTIHREFNEADEANLLEEEDMHVFDSRPLMDPLHLVCCNACKKPVKASQYAAHAERCRLINSTEDTSVELDGGSSHKKPPRKGRKKLQATHDNQGSTIGEQEKSESLEGDEDAVSESNINDKTGMVSSFSKEAKDIPAPLATKIYHLQGNHRLRSALGQMYIEAATRDLGCDLRKKFVQDSPMASSEDTSPNKLLLGAAKDGIPQAEKDACPASAVPNPDQILAQSSEVCLGSGRRHPPSMSFQNQLRDSNFPRPGLAVDGASTGMMRARYHPVAYPFPSDAGTALGKIQQPNGSVPVV